MAGGGRTALGRGGRFVCPASSASAPNRACLRGTCSHDRACRARGGGVHARVGRGASDDTGASGGATFAHRALQSPTRAGHEECQKGTSTAAFPIRSQRPNRAGGGGAAPGGTRTDRCASG